VDNSKTLGHHWLATFAVAILEAAERYDQEME
jgi:hypothetical protein